MGISLEADEDELTLQRRVALKPLKISVKILKIKKKQQQKITIIQCASLDE